MPTLLRALVDYDLNFLQIIASQWDIELAAEERAAAAEELAKAMARPGAIAGIWERLSDRERQAVFEVQAQEGRIPFSHFIRRFGEIRPMGPARREREKPWINPASITEALYYRGLIVRTFEQTAAGAVEHIAIPAELQTLLPQPDPEVVKRPPGYPVAPPRKLEGGWGAAADDVCTILAYLIIRNANSREWLSEIPVEQIDCHLRRPTEYAYRALLVTLLHDLDHVYEERLLTQITSVVNKELARPWLEAPRLYQLRSLAETWRDSIMWNDLAYTPGLDADEWPNDPRLARQAVFDAMREVPAEIWWSLDGFIEYIKETNPDFQRPGGDYGAWYLRDAYTGEILQGFQYWDHVEGALIRCIIEGPMRWLGLIRSAPGAFILTPLGLALLGRADWSSGPDPEARIRVDEQGVINVPAALSRYERLQIARLASWMSAPEISSGTHSLGAVDEGLYQYRLTPQAIARVTGEGINLTSNILPFLQRLSGRGLPANVVKMLEAWHNRPGEVVVQDVVIITARDLGIYERLKSNPRVARWMGRQIGPHAHAVRREDIPALLNAVREMGILPLFEDHEKDNWP